MFTLEVRFLTHRYAAEQDNAPGRAEWPPHPARLFSALTAAHYDAEAPAQAERGALDWLAKAGAPEIFASEIHERALGSVYVPTNDPRALKDIDRYIERYEQATAKAELEEGTAKASAERALERALDQLRKQSAASAAADRPGGTPRHAVEVLERRPRHPRRFPVAVPTEPLVHFRWPEVTPSPEIERTLDGLCARVARLGHSSSLVAVRVAGDDIDQGERTRWRPDAAGSRVLRVPLREQLRLLDEAHARHQQIEPRILPSDPVPYSTAGAERPAGPLVEPYFASAEAAWILYQVTAPPEGGRRSLFDASMAQPISRAFRGTVLAALDPGAPQELTGHDADGKPAKGAHVAFVPLMDVGHPHASGSILGLAVVPPKHLATRDRDLLFEALFRAEQAAPSASQKDTTRHSRLLRLTLGRHGVVYLERVVGTPRSATLTAARWCRPSSRWLSVTPVALGRNPGNLRSKNPPELARAMEAAELTVADACGHIDLPRPAAVWIHARALAQGAPAARKFGPFPDAGSGPRRVLVHVELDFGQPVSGPVIIGAGRFFGLGLCLPQSHQRREPVE